jgi:phosphatidylserine/phosphatidylglycerophosphate/cardiolipin synthase-like enzyme
LLKALCKASKRGVKLVITTNKNDSTSPGMHGLYVDGNKAKLAELLEKGKKENIEIYEYAADFTTLHKKVFVIDDQVVALGSANIGHKSLEGSSDNELNLIIDSTSFAKETESILSVDNENSKRIVEFPINSTGKDNETKLNHTHVLSQLQTQLLNRMVL